VKIAGFQVKRRVFVSVGLIAFVTAATYYWNRFQKEAVPPQLEKAPEPFVKFDNRRGEERDRFLEEKADYFDPTPLFLPTARNYGQGALPATVVRQPGQVFGDFEPVLNMVPETALQNFGEEGGRATVNLQEILVRGNNAPFAGFGQVDAVLSLLPERKGHIEIKALQTGRLNISEALSGDGLPEEDFRPVEFLVAVSPAGLIGDPVMIAGSGTDEVDAGVKEYLTKTYRLGARLAPGEYMVSIGP
jgi:hypothetical protein